LESLNEGLERSDLGLQSGGGALRSGLLSL